MQSIVTYHKQLPPFILIINHPHTHTHLLLFWFNSGREHRDSDHIRRQTGIENYKIQRRYQYQRWMTKWSISHRAIQWHQQTMIDSQIRRYITAIHIRANVNSMMPKVNNTHLLFLNSLPTLQAQYLYIRGISHIPIANEVHFIQDFCCMNHEQ